VGLSIMNHNLYQTFAKFLQKAASANPQVKNLLIPKVEETKKIAASYVDACRKIVNDNLIWTPANKNCFSQEPEISLKELLTFSDRSNYMPSGTDPSDSAIREAQKTVFADPKNANSISALVNSYYKAGHYSHAVAMASLAMLSGGANKSELETSLGCSLLNMGYLIEAASLLKNASTDEAKSCQNKLMSRIKN
jgi:hypothetical protein